MNRIKNSFKSDELHIYISDQQSQKILQTCNTCSKKKSKKNIVKSWELIKKKTKIPKTEMSYS